MTKPIGYCPMCRSYILQRMYSLYEICEYTCLHCKGSFEEVQDIIGCYCCGNKIHCPGSLLSCDISIDVMVYQFQGSVDHWICPFCCFMISQLVTSGSFKVLSEVDDPFRLDVNKTVRARRNRRVSFELPDAVQNLFEEFSAELLVPENRRIVMEVISEDLMPDVVGDSSLLEVEVAAADLEIEEGLQLDWCAKEKGRKRGRSVSNRNQKKSKQRIQEDK
jgi:hypothetical protein